VVGRPVARVPLLGKVLANYLYALNKIITDFMLLSLISGFSWSGKILILFCRLK